MMLTLAMMLLSMVQSPTAAIPAYRKAARVAVIPIRGPIDAVTVASVRQRLAAAESQGADAVVIELDTPGGELSATLELTNLIRTQAPVNTVAWVNPFAFSAGTIIALSAREIVTAPDAMFGDAAPITALGPLPATERAKIESPLLAEVVDEARRHHYDERLVQAFVSVGVELWLLQDRQTGEAVFVDRPEYLRVFGVPPPESMTPITPPSDGEPFQIHPLLTMLAGGDTAEAPDDDIASQPLLPPTRTPLQAEDADRFDVLGQVVASDRLLTLKPHQAEAYGLSVGTLADDEDVRAFFGADDVLRLEPRWSEALVQVMMSWPVRVAFIAIFVVCVLVELTLPGTGWFGIGAIVALAVLVGAPMLIGLASWWDLAAILIGLALIAVELLVIPGTLVAGMCGAVLLLVGLVGSAVSGDLTSTPGQEQLVSGGLIVLSGVLLGWLLAWLVLRKLDTSVAGRGLVLREQVGPPEGAPIGASRVGSVGTAITPLRPSGRIELHGETMDAVCSGRWIEAGTPVRVCRDGLVVSVEPCA
ncbi:MAG: NfeD family protein [Phycisphaerales bacterium]|jgi:membrane-bound serine protease (ClpP class)|nr:NfeD family protein [Phycisphaerales bacterium]